MNLEPEKEDLWAEDPPRCPDCLTRLALLAQRLARWDDAALARRIAPEISREIGRMTEERGIGR